MSLQDAMTPAGPWADLNGELLVSIAAADSLSLRDYKCLRGVCSAWRSALRPPYPCLLSMADDKGSASVFSLPMRRSSHLLTASSPLLNRPRPPSMFPHAQIHVIGSLQPQEPHPGQTRVIGSSSGRFAVAVDLNNNKRVYTTMRVFLLNTRAGKEVELVPPTAVLSPESGACHEYVHKVVFAPGANDLTVVALYDLKKVAYMDTTTSCRKWTTIDDVVASKLVDLAFHNDGKLYCLDSDGIVYMISIPRGGRNSQYEHAVVEPLMRSPDPLVAFAPPYDRAAALTTTKHLFFCNGSMYQMWQLNKGATVTLGGSGFRMAADEIFVLSYDPQRRPCWEAVRDLGGCSVFIGKNSNPAVVRPAGGGQPWVRPNCVYWIDGMCVPMVCDIATGTSNPCILPYGACKGHCWYFDKDIDGDGTKGGSEEIKGVCLYLEMTADEYSSTIPIDR